MHHIMAKFWWLLALRGALAVLLGLTAVAWILQSDGLSLNLLGLDAFFHPAATVATLILLLGLYAFSDGLFSFLLGVQDYGDGRRWPALILEGLVSLAIGVWAWIHPGTAVLVLLYWVAGWALLTGALEVRQALDLNEYKERTLPLFLAGLVSGAFGFLLFFFTRIGGEGLVWLFGFYGISFGAAFLALAFRLKPFAQRTRSRR